MSGDRKHKLPDHVVAPEGTSLFRTINFERYVVSINAFTINLFLWISGNKLVYS